MILNRMVMPFVEMEVAGEIKNDKKERIDKSEVEKVRKAQIDLFGGNTLLYLRVDQNLKEHGFEPLFAREQYKLFTWREKYFNNKFTTEDNIRTMTYDGKITKNGKMKWHTNGGDDSHSFDTVPYQITKHFQDVVELACSKENTSEIYFDNDEMLSSNAKTLFDRNHYLWCGSHCDTPCKWHSMDQLKEELDEMDLSSDAMASMVVAIHGTSPPTLLEIAMQAVQLYQLPVPKIKELEQAARDGLYSKFLYCVKEEEELKEEEKGPAGLSARGRQCFLELRAEYRVTRVRGVLLCWKGSYGFVTVEDPAGNPDDFSAVLKWVLSKKRGVFIHGSELQRPGPVPRAGLRLEFQLENSKKGPKAVMARFVV